MRVLQDTYTFTARSSENPDAIVTFTLTDHSLRVNLAEMLEKIEKVLVSEDKASEVKHQVASQIQPAATKFMQGRLEAIPLDDVNAKFDGDRLTVNTWKRVAGLRLAPLMISIHDVDNPDATEAFVAELNERKSTARHLSRFVGPLDYWIGWIGLLIGAVFIFRWSSRRKDVSD